MKSHDEMIWEWMQDPAFVTAYEALEEEFALFDELPRADNDDVSTAEESDDIQFARAVLASIANGAPTYSQEEMWDALDRLEAVGALPD